MIEDFRIRTCTPYLPPLGPVTIKKVKRSLKEIATNAIETITTREIMNSQTQRITMMSRGLASLPSSSNQSTGVVAVTGLRWRADRTTTTTMIAPSRGTPTIVAVIGLRLLNIAIAPETGPTIAPTKGIATETRGTPTTNTIDRIKSHNS